MLLHRLVVVRKEIKVHLVLVVMDIPLVIIINMLLVVAEVVGTGDLVIINIRMALLLIEIIMVVALDMYIPLLLFLVIHLVVY